MRGSRLGLGVIKRPVDPIPVCDYRGTVSSARDLLAAFLLALAVALGGLWLPAAWITDYVVDQSGFLAVTQPLSDDPVLQRALSDSAVEELLADDRIPGWVETQVTPLAQEQAAKLTDTEAYGLLWDATMVDLHEALYSPGPSELRVDLVPAIDQILTPLDGRLPVAIPRPEQAEVTLATVPDLPLLTTAADLGPRAAWLGPLALGLAVIALALAAHRRSMLVLAGSAAIAAGSITALIAGQIEVLVPDSVDQADFVGPIVRVFEARLSEAVVPQGAVLIGAGALVAAVGLVLVGLHRRS